MGKFRLYEINHIASLLEDMEENDECFCVVRGLAGSDIDYLTDRLIKEMLWSAICDNINDIDHKNYEEIKREIERETEEENGRETEKESLPFPHTPYSSIERDKEKDKEEDKERDKGKNKEERVYVSNVHPVKEVEVVKNNCCSKYTAEFDEVWELYPKKQGKQNALKAYIKARKDGVDKDDIINGINNYIFYIKKMNIEPKYIKQGSTWFNQRCWGDDYTVVEKRTMIDEILNAEPIDLNNPYKGTIWENV